MDKKIILPVIAVFVSITTLAQESKEKNNLKKNCGCQFSSIAQLGILEGESGTTFQLQTINGIRFRTWSVGLGAGLDYYHYRTIPLFVDLRKDILNRSRTPFVYADLGMHFAWVQDENKMGWARTEFSNGLYYGFGVGYRLGLKKKDAFLFSLGYAFKAMEEKRYGTIYCINPPCDERLDETLDYGFRRLSLQLGFNF
jgi:hypothetical protein